MAYNPYSSIANSITGMLKPPKQEKTVYSPTVQGSVPGALNFQGTNNYNQDTTVPQNNQTNSNTVVPISKTAMSGQGQNAEVLNKAQTDVLNRQASSPLQDAYTQKATDWLANPMGGYDPAKTKQATLEKADTDWANAFEAQNRKYGNAASQSGLLQKNILQNALAHNVDQQALESNLDTDAYNKYMDSMGKSIATAQGVNQSNENIFSNRLNDLANVRNMAEGEAGRSLQMTMQDKNLTHDEKMARLNAELDDAKANNDVVRQKEILGFQSDLTFKENEQKYGYDQALLIAKGDIDKMLQAGDNAGAMERLKQTQTWQAQQNDADRILEASKIELQKIGFDYEMLAKEIEAGRVAPKAAAEMVKGVLAGRGITIKPSDPNAILETANRDFMVQQYQYALTHPESAIYTTADGVEVPAGTPGAQFKGLKEESANAFNAFINSTLYKGAEVSSAGKPLTGAQVVKDENGETVLINSDGQPLKGDALLNSLRGADLPTNQNNKLYNDMLNSVPTAHYRISDKFSNDINDEGAGIRRIGDRLFNVSSVSRDSTGRDHDTVTVVDIATGTSKVFNGFSDDPNSINNLDNWVVELGNL